jgi:hypothetical protein
MTGDAASLGVLAAGGGPVAGATTPDATEQLAAGTSVQLDVAKSYAGTKRFAQLPEDLQQSIAAAFKSELGTAAFEPDTEFVISGTGDVKLAAGATVYKTHQAHVTGGGPGDDLALTLKPVRQSKWFGAGDDDSTHDHATITSAPAAGTPTSAPGSTVAGGGAAADSATRKSIFHAGDRATIPALVGKATGTFTWAGLPMDVRQAIEVYLDASPSSTAGAAWTTRQGEGWEFDPAATVVFGTGGEVTFPNGLAITRAAAPAAPAAGAAHDSMPGMDMSGGGDMAGMPMPAAIHAPPSAAPTDTPVGHDADIPPAPPGL